MIGRWWLNVGHHELINDGECGMLGLDVSFKIVLSFKGYCTVFTSILSIVMSLFMSHQSVFVLVTQGTSCAL